MTDVRFYGDRPPGIPGDALPGRLIVVEGPDRVGRSLQIALLKEWLEDRGYAVLDTGFTRSELAGPGIKRAKEGHTLDPITLNLFYATDFWDRLEKQILPALRAGMIVLADRYFFSLIARAVVRGVSHKWMETLYTFAIIPDLVVYLDVDVDQLVTRAVTSGGFDHWESGLDHIRGNDVYDAFVRYQSKVIEEFRLLAERHGFETADARGTIAEVFRSIAALIEPVIKDMGSAARAAEDTPVTSG